MSPLLVFQCLFLCFHILSTCSTSNLERKFISKTANSNDFEEKFYTQTLDHFNFKKESYQTFQQRYFVNSKYWGGASSLSPFFIFLGAEGPLAMHQLPHTGGLLLDNAPQFNAFVIFIEHRFYGKSSPLGSQKDALKDESIRGYFNSAQALADYAKIIIEIKKNLSAPNSPVIVFGGSYGGMLASWFRLKYPHIALGALASSAPVLLFHDITSDDAYFSVVSKDFKDTSESCFDTIKNSWAEIDNVASQPNGFQILSQKFKTCSPLSDASLLKNTLVLVYREAAQNDNPPLYPVSVICNAIDGAAASGKDILDQIFAGASAYYYYNEPHRSCYINRPRNNNYDETISQQQSYDETEYGWSWQSCSEMLMPIGIGGSDSMFQPSPYDYSSTIQSCKAYYHVDPRPDWVTDYYGGHDIELTLKRSGGNIIFSNGLRDPYSAGGVLKNISDTIVAVTTLNGSHIKDLDPTDYSLDPDWLIEQRKTEMKIIRTWMDTYYSDLRMIKPTTSTLRKMEK